jgi:hypothetical protein
MKLIFYLKATRIDRIKATTTEKLRKSLAVHFSELIKESINCLTSAT